MISWFFNRSLYFLWSRDFLSEYAQVRKVLLCLIAFASTLRAKYRCSALWQHQRGVVAPGTVLETRKEWTCHYKLDIRIVASSRIIGYAFAWRGPASQFCFKWCVALGIFQHDDKSNSCCVHTFGFCGFIIHAATIGAFDQIPYFSRTWWYFGKAWEKWHFFCMSG